MDQTIQLLLLVVTLFIFCVFYILLISSSGVVIYNKFFPPLTCSSSFDCRGSQFDVDNNPTSIECSGTLCTKEECCTEIHVGNLDTSSVLTQQETELVRAERSREEYANVVHTRELIDAGIIRLDSDGRQIVTGEMQGGQVDDSFERQLVLYENYGSGYGEPGNYQSVSLNGRCMYDTDCVIDSCGFLGKCHQGVCINRSTGGCVDPCTNDMNTPYTGCSNKECTAINTPYVGCTVPECTNVDTPYADCIIPICTTLDTPYTGCTEPYVCQGVDTPDERCIPQKCTAVGTPYVGCIPEVCTAEDTPYIGCTVPQCTDVDTPYAECSVPICSGINYPYSGCIVPRCTNLAGTEPPGCSTETVLVAGQDTRDWDTQISTYEEIPGASFSYSSHSTVGRQARHDDKFAVYEVCNHDANCQVDSCGIFGKCKKISSHSYGSCQDRSSDGCVQVARPADCDDSGRYVAHSCQSSCNVNYSPDHRCSP